MHGRNVFTLYEKPFLYKILKLKIDYSDLAHGILTEHRSFRKREYNITVL